MANEQIKIDVLMATYNGEKFIRQQLDSLFRQTIQNFRIIIRDDVSSDNTLQIIESYREKFPERILIISDEQKNVGVTQNFNLLLERSEADYIFFCDQDDVWLPAKIETSLAAIQKLENKNIQTPCLVYADMKSIDEQGNIIANSVWLQLNLSPKYFTLNRLLIQNIPHGCTMLINKAMKKLVFPIPKDAILHDHWIALLAAACAKHISIHEPLMLLRNHSSNISRKQTSVVKKIQRFLSNTFSRKEYEYFISIRVRQAKALLTHIGNSLTEENKDLLNHFIQLEQANSIERKKIFLQYKFFRTTFWHNLKMILRS
jgi:glycosyltransferase involved in cell wall biosynthesis